MELLALCANVPITSSTAKPELQYCLSSESSETP